MDFYREVQAAGRCLDIAVPFENLEYLTRHLRPEGLVLRSDAPSAEHAEAVIAAATRWCGSHLGEH